MMKAPSLLLVTIALGIWALTGSFCKEWTTVIPSSVQPMNGLCFYIPCTFTIPRSYDKYLDSTCAVLWRRLFDTDSWVEEKNCSTILEGVTSEHLGSYFLRLNCQNPLKFNFMGLFTRVTIQDSLLQPAIDPSTVEVVEGTVVALKCQAPVICPTLRPRLTWAPQLGPVEDAVEANVIAVMTFTTTHLHNDVSVTCSIIQRRQRGYSELSSERALTVRVLHAPKNTTVSATPPGSLPDGSAVTLRCNGVANPPVTAVTWYRVNGDWVKPMGSGQEITFNVTKLSRDNYYCENRNIHGAQLAVPIAIDVTFAPEILPSSDCQDVSTGIQCSCISQANPPPFLKWEGVDSNSNQHSIIEQSLDNITRRSVIILNSLDSDSGTSLLCISFNPIGVDQLAFDVSSPDPQTGGLHKKNQCPAGWLAFKDNCYQFATDKRGWNSARTQCATKGGHLAIIRNREERTWLESRSITDNWIGLRRTDVMKRWKWIDGTPLNDGIASWSTRKPNNYMDQYETCAVIRSWNRRWNDLNCGWFRGYICQRCQDSDEIVYDGIKGTCNLQVNVYPEVFEVLFEQRLRAGRIIVIQGKVKPNPTKFIVHLSLGHGNDTPLRIEVDFKDGDLELLTRIGSHVGGEYVNKVIKEDSFPFAAGSDFEMNIECGDDIFRLAVGSDYEVIYENDCYDLQDIHRLLVENDVTVTAVRLI
ncbi:myelin-associated glycoprotein-like isoform X2 [Corythoichthys intestinalis]|uniref:myelin-associated glycoprotein-like isoform X2 n=1 Tax=Corythoichthys intestinalis TaxID=161448 RepID=UPI0025A53BA3|nr:myelin-associated glycoprotein-like isoform X2 [Corythoichthys intestinalis]